MFVGTDDADPHAILASKFPAVSGITAGGGQVVPTADGKISILVGADGPLGLTRDGSNTDSMTFTLDDTVVTVGNFTYEAGEPSSTVGGAGSAPSAGSFKITEFENAGFILEVDDSFSDGSDATNFFNEINALQAPKFKQKSLQQPYNEKLNCHAT